MYDVITVGSMVLDVTIRSGEFRVLKGHQIRGGVGLCEVYGGKTEVDDFNMTVGGGGTNSAVSFVKKGLRVKMIVKRGDDEIGAIMKSALDKYGVNDDLVVVDKNGRSALSVILVARDGGRSILTYRGVSKELGSNDIDWNEIEKTKWLYMSSLGGKMSLVEDLISFASKNGIKVAFNPGKAEIKEKVRLMKLFAKIEVLLVNRMELADLLGCKYEDSEQIESKTKKLVKQAGGQVVMTEGREGAVVFGSDLVVRAEAFRVKSVDDTGAGDAFGSGFVYGKIKGWSVADCLKAGVANGAGEVMKIGVKEGLLSDKELDRWMKRELKLVEEKV